LPLLPYFEEEMMTAREQAEELRQEAIRTLLDEKAEIDELLNTLGYQKEEGSHKRRGRPPKPVSEPAEQPVLQPEVLP
jgi:hypothetical protein